MDTSARLPTPTRPKQRLLMFAVATIVAATATNDSTRASDYAHTCRSADGAFAMQDDELRRIDHATGQETGPAISYETLARYDLSRSAGYCIAKGVPKGQTNRFAYQGTTYVLHVSFRQDGTTLKVHMICDLASSGLPAAFNCDREVKTLEWAAPKVKAPEAPVVRDRR